MIFATEFSNDVDFKFIVILAINVALHLVGRQTKFVLFTIAKNFQRV